MSGFGVNAPLDNLVRFKENCVCDRSYTNTDSIQDLINYLSLFDRKLSFPGSSNLQLMQSVPTAGGIKKTKCLLFNKALKKTPHFRARTGVIVLR